MPRLNPDEVAKALMFAICSSPDVLVIHRGDCITRHISRMLHE